MVITWVVLMAFLIWHVLQFRLGTYFDTIYLDYNNGEPIRDLYKNVTIEFTNLPQHNMLQKIIYPPEKVNYYYAAPIALFLLLLIFVVFAIIRVIRTSGSSYSEAQADYEEKIVKDMINKLDSQLENGCINKSEYERRLYILMRRENEISGK